MSAEKTKTTITEEELQELKKKSVEILAGARRALLLKYPFIGSLLMRMDLVPVRDMRVRTACTDGDKVYFDIDFLSRLSTEEQIFVLGHEMYHAVLLHLTRLQARDPELFNIATDKEVNYLLRQDGLTPPCHLLFPEGNEVGKSAEEIYEILLKSMKKQAKQQASQQGQQGQKQKGQTGSSSSSNEDGDEQESSQGRPQNGGKDRDDGQDGENDQDSQQNGQGNKQKKKSKKPGQGGNDDDQADDPDSQNTSGNKDGKLSGQFDRHQYRGMEDTARDGQNNQQGQGQQGQDGDSDSNQNGQQQGGGSSGSPVRDKWGDVGFDKDYKPSIHKDFSDRMREAVIATAQQIERQQGNLPAHIAQIVKGLMKPEIKWQELLAQFVTKCFGTDRKWLPPNRRHVYKRMYLPSRRSEKIKGVVAIDTSGSTQGDLKKFMSELVGLVSSFGGYTLTIIQCDAEVDSVEVYDSDEHPFEVEDEKNFEFVFGGGGGTSFIPPFEYVLENDVEADFMLYLTDGYGPAPDKNELGIPVMWILTKGAASDDFCSFGEKIRFQDDYEQSFDGW